MAQRQIDTHLSGQDELLERLDGQIESQEGLKVTVSE